MSLAVTSISVPGILRDVNLVVKPGQVVALVGANGAGKSTLLRVCAQLHAPQSGRVLLMERPLRAYKARDRARLLGFLPQQTQIEVPYSVRDLIELGAYTRTGGLSTDELERILKQVGMTEYAERDVRTLSGGELQRAMIGKVLAQDAHILLLDEPVSGLDVAYQWDIMQICRTFVADGQKSIFITLHDLELVLQFADYVYLLHAGRIVAQGYPQEVLSGSSMQQAFGARGEVFRDPHTGALRLSLVRV